MRVLVTGGSGVLGSEVTRRLVAGEHRVTVASRHPTPVAGSDTAVVDLADGSGLEAVRGHDVVVHCASDPFATTEVDVDGTRRLVEAAAEAEVGHLVAISIVGIDDHPWPYYRAKVAMEQVVTAGSVPWTLLRCTQFHELVGRFVDLAPGIGLLPVPRRVALQPIAQSVVARRLVELVEAGPSGRVADLGGPEVLDLRDMVRQLLRARGQPRLLVPVPLLGRWARAFRDGRMLVEERTPGPTYAEHLRDEAV